MISVLKKGKKKRMRKKMKRLDERGPGANHKKGNYKFAKCAKMFASTCKYQISRRSGFGCPGCPSHAYSRGWLLRVY